MGIAESRSGPHSVCISIAIPGESDFAIRRRIRSLLDDVYNNQSRVICNECFGNPFPHTTRANVPSESTAIEFGLLIAVEMVVTFPVDTVTRRIAPLLPPSACNEIGSSIS